MTLREVYDRVTAVEVQFRAAKESVAYFLAVCESDPTRIKSSGLHVGDVRGCLDGLEDTYLIRAFAIFETALRDYWRAQIGRTHPRTEHLIDKVAARRTALTDDLRGAHAVRCYRNWLVHGGHTPQKVTMPDGKRHMCRFLRHLPMTW